MTAGALEHGVYQLVGSILPQILKTIKVNAMSSDQETHSVSLLVRPLPGPPLDVLECHHGGLLQLLEAFWVGEVLEERI